MVMVIMRDDNALDKRRIAAGQPDILHQPLAGNARVDQHRAFAALNII